MELKAQIVAPYGEEEKINFIVEYNHKKGYEIRETEVALEAWGKTEAEIMFDLKEEKYKEANTKANAFLESGEALFEFEEGKHIEATDGNISKLGLSLVDLVLAHDSSATIEWNTKEDENVSLNAEQLRFIVDGLKRIQAVVWTVEYPHFLDLINRAQTIEEIKEIDIEYIGTEF